MPRRPILALAATRVAALAVVVSLSLSGCTALENRPAPSATAVPTTAPSGDGILRIGTLFPMTGDAAALGAAQVAGAELAAREIFEQGGVLGQAIELLHRDSASDWVAALADLLARGVDVVLWDATNTVPTDSAAAVAAAHVALLPLGNFVTDGILLTADDVFSARLRSADPGLTGFAGGRRLMTGSS